MDASPNLRVYVGSTLTIIGGVVLQSLTANGILGAYEATTNTKGAAAPAVFTPCLH